jgi:hypothetical protein
MYNEDELLIGRKSTMKAADIPYQLLGQMERDAPLRGLSGEEESDHNQNVTAAYITTMYYSALSNLYLQSILPETMTEVDEQMPRVKIAFERSFADFTKAFTWLKTNAEFINSSSAKEYYDEVSGLDEGAVKNMTTFYHH